MRVTSLAKGRFRKPFRATITFATIATAGCASAPPPSATSRASQSASVTPEPPAAKPGPRDDEEPALLITLRPIPGSAPHVHVELALHAGVEPRARWSIGRAHADGIKALTARDDGGALALDRRDDGARAWFVAPRDPRGKLTVAYDVDAAVPAVPTPPPVALDPDRFEARGDALLLVPETLGEKSVRVRVSFDTSELGANQSARAASSFGVGATVDTSASAREIGDALFVAGAMGQARLDGPEGHDEAAWLGYTTFDPRPALADMAGYRTAVRQILKDDGSAPSTLFFLADSRKRGDFSAARHTRSVALRVGVGEPWSGPVRIAVATALLREWIGERLWIGPTDAAHEAEAYWFTEGFTRAFARELLFKFGLVTSSELASDVEGATALVATSARRGSANAELAARAKEPGALPLLVARGATYATRLDAILREKSEGKRSLDELMADLYARGRAARGPLAVDAFLAALDASAGSKERDTFAAAVFRGAVPDLPEGALGPCFRRVKKTFVAFELGFDEARSRASDGHAIVGLDPNGPAARAGVRPTDKLVAIEGAEAGRGDAPIEVLLERDGAQKRVRYVPAGASARAHGWERKKDVPEDACSKR